jgi:hypothetical protein
MPITEIHPAAEARCISGRCRHERIPLSGVSTLLSLVAVVPVILIVVRAVVIPGIT